MAAPTESIFLDSLTTTEKKKKKNSKNNCP